jgi:hypothetical protein
VSSDIDKLNNLNNSTNPNKATEKQINKLKRRLKYKVGNTTFNLYANKC